MSKWVVDIHGEIEGDYEIIKKYEEPKTEVLDKIRAEIERGYCKKENDYDGGRNMGLHIAIQIIDKYIKGE